MQAQRANESHTISNCIEGHTASFTITSLHSGSCIQVALDCTWLHCTIHSARMRQVCRKYAFRPVNCVCVCFRTTVLGKEEKKYTENRKNGLQARQWLVPLWTASFLQYHDFTHHARCSSCASAMYMFQPYHPAHVCIPHPLVTSTLVI